MDCLTWTVWGLFLLSNKPHKKEKKNYCKRSKIPWTLAIKMDKLASCATQPLEYTILCLHWVHKNVHQTCVHVFALIFHDLFFFLPHVIFRHPSDNPNKTFMWECVYLNRTEIFSSLSAPRGTHNHTQTKDAVNIPALRAVQIRGANRCFSRAAPSKYLETFCSNQANFTRY